MWKKRKIRKELKNFKKNLRYILHVNDDVYPAAAKEKIQSALDKAGDLAPEDTDKVEEFLSQASRDVDAVLPKKSFPLIREYADILCVALCVAFGIRALFLQPFKIPTSSMQPTLFGIHYIADKNTLPHLPDPLQYALFSTQRAKLVVRETGELDQDSVRKTSRLLFFPWTRFIIERVGYSLPGTPDKVDQYAFKGRRYFEAGETVCDGWLSLGDHLFVDRYTFHLREPRRGDVVVFNTEDITYKVSPRIRFPDSQGHDLAEQRVSLVDRGYYYIKRLIGLPGDTLRIKDGVVYVKPKGIDEEKPLTHYAPNTGKLYGYRGGYHGHTNSPAATHLKDSESTFTVPEDTYFVMGDNSRSSFDSRYWGVVPRRNIVGRAFFVFWPFSRRWGFVDRVGPLDVETTDDGSTMHLQ